MRNFTRNCRGFTLIELMASITILGILAAVALPRMTAALPFMERGYADAVAAALREARGVAVASGCPVQFTIDVAGYRAFQRPAAGTHCANAGAWSTPVRRTAGLLQALQPADVVLAANRQFIFAADGAVAAGAQNINIGPQIVTVGASGLVQGP